MIKIRRNKRVKRKKSPIIKKPGSEVEFYILKIKISLKTI